MKLNFLTDVEAFPEGGVFDKLGTAVSLNDDAIEYLKSYISALESHIEPKEMNSDFQTDGDVAEIDAVLISESAADFFFDIQGINAVFEYQNHPSNVFGDGTHNAKRVRVLMIAPKAWESGDFDDADALKKWVIDVAEELKAAEVFLENSRMRSPHDIDTLAKEDRLQNDMFDMLTSYGIRGLVWDERSHVADAMEDASPILHEYCEIHGQRLARDVLRGDMDPQVLLGYLQDQSPSPSV